MIEITDQVDPALSGTVEFAVDVFAVVASGVKKKKNRRIIQRQSCNGSVFLYMLTLRVGSTKSLVYLQKTL